MACNFTSRVSVVFTGLLFFGMAFSAPASAQDCVPTDINLTSQSEVEDFQANHGPCDRVTGNLLIGNYGDAVNLNGLSGLVTVDGNLTIQNNFELTDVSGLGNLTRVGGVLYLNGNEKLPNLNGMSKLTHLGLDLVIQSNDALVDFNGLQGLSSVGTDEVAGDIIIHGNDSLTNVDGLFGLSSINGSLRITGNSALIHLGGLANITYIGGGLTIGSNESLNDTDGLSNLSMLGGDLRISGNDALTELNGLLNLIRIRGNLEITRTTALTRFDGLDNLRQLGGFLYINHNIALHSFSLSGLDHLPSRVEIWDNPELASLDGLDNLIYVGGYLWINHNGSLASVSGLSNLTAVVQSLELRNNGALPSLKGLEKLESVGRIQVQANPLLSDCTALSQLLDSVDDPPWGPGAPLSAIPDVAGDAVVGNNGPGCDSLLQVMASTPVNQINSGMNDAWFNPDTGGQGFLIVVYPATQRVFLSWYTYDIERPPDDVTAFIGDPGHRWLTAQGEYADNQAVLDIWIAKGGVFDSAFPVPVLDPDGEIILEFDTCNSGTVTYHIPSVEKQGVIPIERIALDNAAYCAGLNPRLMID
jgi:hypothetical protein